MKVSNCKPAAPGRYNQTAITEVAEATNVKEHKTKKGSRTLTIREASKYFFFLSPPGHRTTVEEAWHLCRRQPQCFWRLSHSRNTQLTHHTEVPTIHIRFLIKCTLYAGHCHWRGENYLSYIRLKSSHVKGELLTEAQNLYTLQVNFLFKQFHNLNSIFSCSPFESLSISQEYTGTKQFFTCFSVSFRAEHDYSSK